jgi:hypothetical protein
MILIFVGGFAVEVPSGPDKLFAPLSELISIWSGNKLAEERAALNNTKTLRRTSSSQATEVRTAFKLLTLMQSVPIFATLQSVGRVFSRGFSQPPARNFCEIIFDS